jgi:hypothetical protein
VHEALPEVHEASPIVHEATHEVHEAPRCPTKPGRPPHEAPPTATEALPAPGVDFTQLAAPAPDPMVVRTG